MQKRGSGAGGHSTDGVRSRGGVQPADAENDPELAHQPLEPHGKTLPVTPSSFQSPRSPPALDNTVPRVSNPNLHAGGLYSAYPPRCNRSRQSFGDSVQFDHPGRRVSFHTPPADVDANPSDGMPGGFYQPRWSDVGLGWHARPDGAWMDERYGSYRPAWWNGSYSSGAWNWDQGLYRLYHDTSGRVNTEHGNPDSRREDRDTEDKHDRLSSKRRRRSEFDYQYHHQENEREEDDHQRSSDRKRSSGRNERSGSRHKQRRASDIC